MIPLAEINRETGRFGVPAETIEKDYVISWILVCLSKSVLKEHFIFYGGTAIKKVHFENHRFSEDIDLLSVKDFEPDDVKEQLLGALRNAKEEANLILGIDPGRILTKGTRTQIFVSYSGYEEIIGAPKEVRVDFAVGMDSYGEIKEERIHESYSDLRRKNIILPVHTLNTILAGKLGLLMDATRKEPRDLFDIWFLLNRLDQFDFDLEKVRHFFKQKYGYFPSFGVLRPHLENRLYKERWGIRLEKQVANLPAIETVVREIESDLKKLFGHPEDNE
jgi:hypothetical protein